MFVEPEVGPSYPSIFNLGEINSYQLNALLSRLGKKKKKYIYIYIYKYFLLKNFNVKFIQLYGDIIHMPVQFSSVTQSCPTLHDPMNHRMLGLPVHHQLPEFTQTHVHESVMPSNHLIFCHPLLLLPSIFPSSRVFSNESVLWIR